MLTFFCLILAQYYIKVQKSLNVLANMAGFAVVILLLLPPAVVNSNGLFPVILDVQVNSSQHCEEGISGTKMSVALKVVSQLISKAISPSALPKSCLEIKNSLPSGILSGYYTIMDAATGNVSVVFCDMEGLESCSALEQAFVGLQDDYKSLLEEMLWVKSEQNISVTVLQQMQNDLASVSKMVSDTKLEQNVSVTVLQQMQNDLASVSKMVSDTFSSTNSVLSALFAYSCEDVSSLIPNSVSGHYMIMATNGSYQQVYCLFETLCGSRVNYNGRSSDKSPDAYV